ncbi:hypothetical protein, partial [Candidatus Sodalis sp. SoCistrobi]|uniref:hypothetical protein n=1 Tax=Candidatus Sodalis sp. SoCistrobi TaxID=1922216 RepID=UPI001C270FF7
FRQMDHATQRLETCYEPIHVDVWRTNLQLSDGAIYTKKFTDPSSSALRFSEHIESLSISFTAILLT